MVEATKVELIIDSHGSMIKESRFRRVARVFEDDVLEGEKFVGCA